jgi:threonine dehydratase
MRAFGAELVVHGADFDAAKSEAMAAASSLGLEPVPSFHPDLVKGVGTYALELFTAAGELDTVYVPIGLGSGICGVITVRDLLGLKTKVVGVVSTGAPCYALSVASGHVTGTNSVHTFADGMAVRRPDPLAFEVIKAGADRIVMVDDGEVAEAIRIYHTDTHNLAEGAGAAPLAALLKEGAAKAGKRVGVILSGGNIDRDKFAEVLGGVTPSP